MLRLYGDPIFRSHRTMWMMEELELDYEQVPGFTKDGEPLSPQQVPGPFGWARDEVLALNPNGKIPVLRDGDAVIWESLAVNLYLAMAYPSPLTPKTTAEWGQAFQWSLWAASEIEEPLFRAVAIKRDVGLAKATASEREALQTAERSLERPLRALNAALKRAPTLIGDRFTVADLNAASVLTFALAIQLEFEPFPNVHSWLISCLTRPAGHAVFAKVAAEGMAHGFVGELDTGGIEAFA